ncbi:MAG TPA: response regulator [Clostridiales bacterium]|nr:response regulator [Clostridiales bacterium]
MKRIIGLMIAALLLVLAYAVLATYHSYTKTVIQQQQEHLLVISRSVAQNMELFLSEQLRDVDILVKTPGFVDEMEKYYEFGAVSGAKEYVLSYMLSQQEGLSRIYLLDINGNEVFRYNQYPFLEEFDESELNLKELCKVGQTGMGKVFCIKDKHYGLTLINTIYAGSGPIGYIVGIVDLQSLFKTLVAPLNARESDYITVKDETGRIVMHQNPNLLGVNLQTDYADLLEDPQYVSLKKVLEHQLTHEEGTGYYRTFLSPGSDEIVAYTRMNLGGTSWFVSATMPLSQALQPVNENLGQFAFLVVAIIAVLFVGAIVIQYLIRKRQRLEIQTRYLKEINATLEELHQNKEQVRHYQKLQTIGALAGSIAHEFNNLLTPILGYCEFIKERLNPQDEIYEDVDEIHKAGKRAKEIVEQLLPFSRRENDSSTYTSVSLDAIIRDVTKMIRMILPSSITLEENVRDLGANVYGSATQLHQVLLNLCTNAYQAMELNGGVLTISNRIVGVNELPEGYYPNEEATRYGVVEVSDTGAGMSPEVMEHIFDPFFTTKQAGEGTGLGLSVAMSIVNNHGGVIQVESTLGKGSKFSVYLPLTDISTAPEALQPTEKDQHCTAVRLMLVDDEHQIVQYMKRRLVKAGYETESFTSAEKALAAFEQNPRKWGAVIVDYTMPKYKGTDLARRMRKLAPTLPIILITGLVEKEAIQMQQQGVLSEILIKPIDFTVMLQMIERMTKQPE